MLFSDVWINARSSWSRPPHNQFHDCWPRFQTQFHYFKTPIINKMSRSDLIFTSPVCSAPLSDKFISHLIYERFVYETTCWIISSSIKNKNDANDIFFFIMPWGSVLWKAGITFKLDVRIFIGIRLLYSNQMSFWSFSLTNVKLTHEEDSAVSFFYTRLYWQGSLLFSSITLSRKST